MVHRLSSGKNDERVSSATNIIFPPNRCFSNPVSRNCSCGKVRYVFEAKYCHMCGEKLK